MDDETIRDIILGLSGNVYSSMPTFHLQCPSGASRQVGSTELKEIAKYVCRLESGLVHFAIKCTSLEKYS